MSDYVWWNESYATSCDAIAKLAKSLRIDPATLARGVQTPEGAAMARIQQKQHQDAADALMRAARECNKTAEVYGRALRKIKRGEFRA